MINLTKSYGNVDYYMVEQKYPGIEYPGSYHYCIEDKEETLILTNMFGKTIEIEREHFTFIEYLQFEIGDIVERTFDGKIGKIYNIMYITHDPSTNVEDYMAYLVEFNGRKSTRRSRAEELKKVK